MTGAHPTASFPALGSTASLVLTEPDGADEALFLLRDELDRIDLACSRFREDSELSRLNAHAGKGPVPASELFIDALEAALRAARITEGLVDPTVGLALDLVGYDRDFGLIDPDGPPLDFVARPVPGWQAVTVGRQAGTVALRAGTRLDLGATAKALCADRAAGRIAQATGAGVLVALGGDIAVAGPPPPGGWAVKIGTDHAAPLDGPGPVVSIREGGLATSSTSVRTWRRGGQIMHHLIDPASSKPVPAVWEAVSVAGDSCLDANIASCAAMVLGADAVGWLEGFGLPARLLGRNGQVVTVGGWPSEEAAACC